MGHRTLAALAAAASIIALAACAAPANTTTKAADVAPASTAAPTPTQAAPAAFGDSVKFPSGVSVVVTAVASAAGQYASGAVDGKIVTVTIKITNGSGKQINGGMMSVPKVSYGSAGKQAMGAVDSQNGHSMQMVSAVMPGETQTAAESFGIPAAEYGNVRVEVSGPEFTDSPAVFKGAVK